MKLKFFALFTLLLISGCRHLTKLEHTTSMLKPGMNKVEVKQLYAQFPLLVETSLVTRLTGDGRTKCYGTNTQCASMLVYKSDHPDSFAGLAVYFDTNEVIVAHSYLLGD